MEEKNKKKEIIEGYFVGDTVFLKEETEFSKKNNFKINTIGIVSKNDTKESLEGWKVVDFDKRISEIVDNMEPDKIKELYSRLLEISNNQKEENSDNPNSIIN
tara:strand:+ start:37 stop:345 length:309 start_codon:yes stop_codon:yes gene_type:complete